MCSYSLAVRDPPSLFLCVCGCHGITQFCSGVTLIIYIKYSNYGLKYMLVSFFSKISCTGMAANRLVTTLLSSAVCVFLSSSSFHHVLYHPHCDLMEFILCLGKLLICLRMIREECYRRQVSKGFTECTYLHSKKGQDSHPEKRGRRQTTKRGKVISGEELFAPRRLGDKRKSSTDGSGHMNEPEISIGVHKDLIKEGFG